MATVDLVQLQWQNIRSLEREQAAEQWNIRLKQDIKELEAKLEQANGDKTALKAFADKVLKVVNKSATCQRAEIQRLKLAFIKEMNESLKEKQKVDQGFSKLILILPAKDKQIKSLDNKVNELTLKIKDLESQMKSSKEKDAQADANSRQYQQEAMRLASTINKLKENIKQEEGQNQCLRLGEENTN
jgi:hypothetical protein